MPTISTLHDPETTFDQAVLKFLETDFDQTPEGMSEVLPAANYTILVSRDPLRPHSHWCITILRDGFTLAAETSPTDDLTLTVSRACNSIRKAVVQTMQEISDRYGFVKLE